MKAAVCFTGVVLLPRLPSLFHISGLRIPACMTYLRLAMLIVLMIETSKVLSKKVANSTMKNVQEVHAKNIVEG